MSDTLIVYPLITETDARAQQEPTFVGCFDHDRITKLLHQPGTDFAGSIKWHLDHQWVPEPGVYIVMFDNSAHIGMVFTITPEGDFIQGAGEVSPPRLTCWPPKRRKL